MSLGKREVQEQGQLWVASTELPRSDGHPFYDKLNSVLSSSDFDGQVEELCTPFYADRKGRPGIPPGVYFRMIFIGYFEGIRSQRQIAWRCRDSLSLRSFLGIPLTERSPDHSSLTVIRKRLPLTIHEQVFAFVLSILHETGVVKGKLLAVDSTMLEANASMNAIRLKVTGKKWKEYLKQLAEAEGIEKPTDEDLRRMDRKRKDKKVSNQDWESPADPDSRIARMKDGRTRLAYKGEHAIDLETGVVLSARVHHADLGDTQTIKQSLVDAQINLVRCGSQVSVQEVVADKGYQSNDVLTKCMEWGMRTYIPERKVNGKRRWKDKAAEYQKAVYANRRRMKGNYGKRVNRMRSEKVERSFAHVCVTGGGRRTWIRGIQEVNKRYLIQVASHNLGVLMRAVFGVGTPRALQGIRDILFSIKYHLLALCRATALDIRIAQQLFRIAPTI